MNSLIVVVSTVLAPDTILTSDLVDRSQQVCAIALCVKAGFHLTVKSWKWAFRVLDRLSNLKRRVWKNWVLNKAAGWQLRKQSQSTSLAPLFHVFFGLL